MEDNASEVSTKYAEDSFQMLFWQQQLRAAKLKSKNSMRWHPLMIKLVPNNN